MLLTFFQKECKNGTLHNCKHLYLCPMSFKLHQLPRILKATLVVFLLALAFGYFSGLDILGHTTDFKAQGVEESVLGNNMDMEAEELKFKMSERELHGIIHSHVITLSLLFLILELLIYFTTIPKFLKRFLMVEPNVSLVLTFGGLWLLWSGVLWMKYLVMISGVLMHLSVIAMIVCLLYELILVKHHQD